MGAVNSIHELRDAHAGLYPEFPIATLCKLRDRLPFSEF